MPVVKVPDGRLVNFPDDMPRAEIKSIIAGKFPDAFPTPAEPEETSLLGYGLETGKALLGGAAGLLESAATGASFILPEEAEQAARARIKEIGGGVQEFLAPEAAYEDNTYLDLVRGVGSTVPFLAAAPFGVAGLAAGALTGITAGAGEAAQRAVAAGATEEEISKAAGLGTIPGALEMFGPARIVGRFRKVLGRNADDVAEELSGSIVRKISQATERAPLGRVGKAAIDEGIQEAIAEVGQNLIQRGVYDPERGVFTDTGESFGLGAGVGGLLQGLAEAIIPGRQRAAARKAEEAAAAEQAAVTEGEAVAGEEAMAAVPVDETRDMFPEERAAAEQQFQGPEPERLLDVEELAGTTEEAPIQVRPAPTPETDLIADLEETQQVEEMLVEDELDAMQVEEDAAKASLDAAVTQELGAIEVAERENALKDVQQRIEARRAEETQAKRGPILEAVLAADTTSQVNTERAFSKALAEAGIANTTPTEVERQAIALKTYELAQQRPEPEVVEPEVVADGTGVAELEAAIPEAGRRQAAQPEAAAETLITPEFFDSLGLPKSAPIRRRQALQGKEVSSPEVQKALQALIKNPKTSKQTRANLLNYRAFGKVVTPTAKPTTPVFTPPPEANAPKSRETATTISPDEFLNLATDLPENRVDLDSEKFIREQIAKGEPLDTPFLNFELDDKGVATVTGHEGRHRARILKEMGITEMPVRLKSQGKNEIRWSEQSDPKNYDRLDVLWPTTLKPQKGSTGTSVPFPIADPLATKPAVQPTATTAQPAAPTVALPVTDAEKLANRKVKPAPARGKYTPEASVSFYMQNTTDADQALRAIALEGTEPVALQKTSPKDVPKKEMRRAEAATTWVRNNLSPEANTKLDEYKAFYERAENRGEEFVEKLTAEQDARDQLEAEYIEQAEKQDDALTQEILEEIDVYGADLDDIAGVIDYLRSDAVAATMPTVSDSTNNKVLDGDLKGALKQLATDSPNPMVRRTAAVLSEAIKDTKIEFVEALETPRGDQFAGNYIPSQDLIQISLASPLSTHTILHEAAHAVTSKVLDNKAHPVTIQLTKLFNDIKDKLPQGSYGRESLKDFVAEAYTNAEFRAILAAHKPTGAKLTAWQRFTNAVKRLLGMAPTEVQNMEQETIDYINVLMAESIATRDATTVTGALAEGDAIRAVYDMMGGGTALAKAKTLQDSRDRIWANSKEFTAKSRMTLINGMTLANLVDLIRDRLPSADKLQQLIFKQDGERNELMKDFGAKLNDFKAAFKGDSKAIETFNTLVGLSTIEEVDPTKPESRYKQFGYSYTAKDGSPVEKIAFDTEAQRDEAIEALDRTDVVGGVKKLNSTPERGAAYQEARRMYDSLTPSQKTVYSTLRDMYKNMNEAILQSIDAKLEALDLEEGVKATVKDQVLRKMLSSGVIDPYFKLDRTGDFWIEWSYKDADGQVTYGVSAHKTPGEREIARKRLKENPNVIDESINEKARPDMSAQGVNVPTTFLVELLKEMDKPVTITEADGTTREVKIPQGAIDLVNDVLKRSLPEQGLIQGHQQRAGYAGYETEALLTFEQSYPAMINSLANLKYELDFTLVTNEIKEEAASGANANDRLVQDIKTALVGTKEETGRQPGKLPSYLEFVKNPNLPNWARKARSLSFIYTLGFNISSAAVNMSTLPMIVGPLLSGKFGGAKATSAMGRAMKMYTQSFGEVTREGITKEGELGEVKELGGFSYTNKKGGPLGPLIERIKAIGLDTRTIASENADYENPATPFLNKLSYISGFVFNHSERAIRQVTAASSYILEVEKAYADANKGKPAKKIDEMSEAEIELFGEPAAKVATEFMEYANSSALLATAPRWAQTGPGAIIYQFKRFPAQILYIQMSMLKALQRQARGAKRTPEQIEEDRALRSAFVYMTATGGALVGVKGIPFYGLVAAIADMFLDEDEDDTNTIVAKTIGDGFYYGAVAKYFGTDVTDRVALTNLMIRDKGNYRPDNDIQYALESFGGPTVGIGVRLKDSYDRLTDDNPRNDQRAWEAALPTAFGNLKKSLRYSAEGYETTRGDAIVGDVTVGDAIRQTMGFAPAKFRAAQDKLARDRRVTNGVKAMRTGLLDRFAFAHNNGDEAAKQEVLEDIRAFNQKHGNVAIEGDNLIQSIKTRAKGSAVAEQLGGNVAERRFIRSLLESRDEYEEL